MDGRLVKWVGVTTTLCCYGGLGTHTHTHNKAHHAHRWRCMCVCVRPYRNSVKKQTPTHRQFDGGSGGQGDSFPEHYIAIFFHFAHSFLLFSPLCQGRSRPSLASCMAVVVKGLLPQKHAFRVHTCWWLVVAGAYKHWEVNPPLFLILVIKGSKNSIKAAMVGNNYTN